MYSINTMSELLGIPRPQVPPPPCPFWRGVLHGKYFDLKKFPENFSMFEKTDEAKIS